MANKRKVIRVPYVYNESFLENNNTVLAYASTPLHKHEFWEFVYCIKGASNNIFTGILHKNIPGQVLFIRPEDTHENIVYKFPYSHRDIYISCEELKTIMDSIKEGLYEKLFAHKGPISFNINMSDVLFMENIIAKSYIDVCLLSTPIRNVIITTLLGLYISNGNSVVKKPEWIDTFCEKIDEMISDMENGIVHDSSTLYDISTQIGYEYTYASKLFKKYLGVSPQVYYINKKMSLAALMLENGKMISDIATKLGYTSDSHFVNAFKKFYSVSPTEWKKNRLS